MIKSEIIIFFILGSIFILAIYFDDSSEIYEKRVENFKLECKGTLLSIDEKDHNYGFAKVLIVSSNFNEFKGIDCNGKNIVLKEDTLCVSLGRFDCLEVGNSVFIGPRNNYVIKTSNLVIYSEIDKIDICYQEGKRN